MKLTLNAFVLAAVTFLYVAYTVTATAVQPLSGAGATCDNWSLLPDTATLQADCENTSGQFKTTTIPISNCVANDNGALSCRASGGAGSSCVFFDLVFSLGNPVFDISAHCKLEDGSTNTVNNFDIGNCLTNNNGKLGC